MFVLLFFVPVNGYKVSSPLGKIPFVHCAQSFQRAVRARDKRGARCFFTTAAFEQRLSEESHPCGSVGERESFTNVKHVSWAMHITRELPRRARHVRLM